MAARASEAIWITGGGSGIGRALALEYARAGAQVWISGRDPVKLEQVVAEAQSLSGAVHAHPLDVLDEAAVAEAVAQLDQASGGFDRVVLCAGNHIEMPLTEFNQATCEQLMQVNYFGITRVLASLLPHCLARGRGQIALVASLAGYRGLPRAAAYSASKAAVIALAETLRVEAEGTGVDIRLINPGFVRSPLTDKNDFEMPFLMETEDAAKAIRTGLSSSRFEIRFPRPFTWILQLLSMLPYTLYVPLVRRITKQ